MTPSARMAALAKCLRGCNPQWRTTGYVCSLCDQRKEPEQFYLRAAGRRDTACKDCRKAVVLARYHERKAHG